MAISCFPLRLGAPSKVFQILSRIGPILVELSQQVRAVGKVLFRFLGVVGMRVSLLFDKVLLTFLF